VARRDAGMSAAQQEELDRWLEADPRHREALGLYDSAWSALAQPTNSGAGAELERHLATLAGRRGRRRMTTAGAAAALVVLLGLGVVMRQRSGVIPASSAPTALVLAPVRKTLPDGSVVELRGSAKISVNYTATARRVVLSQGEAYFSVEKDTARAFIVSAGGVDVRAVGTAFSVQLGTSTVEVVVTHGAVAVDKSLAAASAEAPRPASPATVDAGKRVLVNRMGPANDAEASVVPTAEMGERLAWRSLRLEFTRTPLAEAIALLNQHAPPTAARLTVADATIGAMRVTGVFRADNTDGFVHLLEGAFGVKAERSGNLITLRKAE